MATQFHGRERGNRIWSTPTGNSHMTLKMEAACSSGMLVSIHRCLSLYVEPVLLKISIGIKNA
jgi:hypothetical protein